MMEWLKDANWFLIIGVVVIAHFMKKLMMAKQQSKVENPETYEDYITKLCLILEKNVFEVFKIAMEEKSAFQFNDERVKQDVNRFLKEKYVPSYVKSFIDEGKKTIEEIKVFEYNQEGGYN